MAQGKAAVKFKALAAAKGFHIVTMMGLSPNILFSRVPIKTAADLNGKKIRTVPGKVHVQTRKDWGALPVPMALGQVYTSLQEGTIQAVEDPPDVALKMKFPEVAPYVAVARENAFVEYVAVSKKWYDALPAKLQKAVD